MSWEEKISKGVLAMADGDFRAAEQAFHLALSEAESRFGHTDAKVSQTLGFLGLACFKGGRNILAQEYLQKTLDTGMSSLDAAIAHLSLAQVSEDSADAITHLQKAIGLLQENQRELDMSATEATLASNQLSLLFKVAAHSDNRPMQRSFLQLLEQAQFAYKQSCLKDEFFGPAPEKQLAEWDQHVATAQRMMSIESTATYVRSYEELNCALRLGYQLFDHSHPRIADNLLLLAEVSIKLGFSDEACHYLAEALKHTTGKSPSELRRAAVTKIWIAALHSDVYDFSAAMRYMAEAVELLSLTDFKPEECANNKMASSLLCLMQQSQLFTSAHALVTQAIELEESDRLEQSNYLFENSLILLRQLASNGSLEIAQVMRFQAAVLRKLERHNEAELLESEANRMEEEVLENARLIERFRQSLPTSALHSLIKN